MAFLRLVWEGLSNALISLLESFVAWLSFSNQIETMVDAVNHKLDEPTTKIGHRLLSHPGGFIRELGKRRLTIAGSYIKIARDLSPRDNEERLAALRMLAEQSLHAKTISMPLNTARVQINLMKEVVKAQGDRRRQMEAMADFGLASFGHESVIRDFLAKYNLVEVPEEDRMLKDLDMGWDDHVHDFLSEGRKTPTQVILDAFVKGMSRLTVVHSTVDEPQLIHEAITAGSLLGIRVQIGIEFSVGHSGARRHYMFVPPPMDDSQAFFAYFADRHEVFSPFLTGLHINAENRRKTMVAALERFNSTQRPKINLGYSPGSPCWLPPLTMEELERLVTCGQVNRVHLSELLFQRMKVIVQARVLELKAQVLAARERFRRGIYSEWELKNISTQYEHVREQYETMNPDTLAAQHLDNRDVVDYDSAFLEEDSLLDTLLTQGGKVIWIHPLEIGAKEAMVHFLKHAGRISHLEVINLRDSAFRNPNDIILFNKFIFTFNNRPADELAKFLEQNGVEGITTDLVVQAQKAGGSKGAMPICGSDSTGRDPAIPGMGFIRANRIPETTRQDFMEHHYRLPRPVAEMVLLDGKKDREISNRDLSFEVICMGKIGKPFRNLVGDEPPTHTFSLANFLRYLNPTVKNVFRIGVGFSAAFAYMQSQYLLAMGLFFACLWFFITGCRNFMVDMIASSGTDFRSWSLKNVNIDNIAQSLFWTGFSVPILGFVKTNYDTFWPLESSGLLFETVKFLFICVANGLYISIHNKLRQFDGKVIRANFFRTLLAWPFATATSPLGNLLGIPSIVQAKIWSDCMGGIIEGSGKFRQRFILRQRDLQELLPRLNSIDRDLRLTTMLDILYIWARQPRGKTCLTRLLLPERSFFDRVRSWWGSGPTPEQERERAAALRANFEKLQELFGDPGCLVNLTEFVLKHFSDKDAVLLTEMVGEQLEQFRGWMRWLRRVLADPGHPTSSVEETPEDPPKPL